MFGPAYRQVGVERKERGGDLQNVRIAAPQCQIPYEGVDNG